MPFGPPQNTLGRRAESPSRTFQKVGGAVGALFTAQINLIARPARREGAPGLSRLDPPGGGRVPGAKRAMSTCGASREAGRC